MGSMGVKICIECSVSIRSNFIPFGLLTLQPHCVCLLFKSPISKVDSSLLKIDVTRISFSCILRFGCWYAVIILMVSLLYKDNSIAMASIIIYDLICIS